MSAVHLHLLLNHIPIAGLAFGVLTLLAGMVRRSPDLKNMGLLIFLLAALAAIPTFLSGEPAEEIVEKLPGVSETILHDHEEAGEIALIAIEILGGLSLLGLLLSLRSRGAPNFLYLLCLLLSLGVGGVMAYTANLGGQVRHTEIRPDFMPLPASPPAEKDD